ncbi:MAG: FG-GAP-like repeat-containing protein [Phycisphaerales bacterium]
MNLKRFAAFASSLALLVAAPLSLSRAGETAGVDIAVADLNGDNVVDAADRNILFADWGSEGSPNDIFLGSPANGPTSNGVVDVDDLNIIQQFFGQPVTTGQTDFSILGADFGDTVIAPGLIKGSPVVTNAANGFYVDPLASVFGSGFYAPLNSAIQTFPSIEFTSYLNFDTGPSTAAFTANGPDFSTPGFGVNDGHFETFGVASGAWYTDTPEGSTNVAGVGEAVHVARLSIDRGANLNTQSAQLRALINLGGANIQTVLMPLDGGPALFDEFGANLPFPVEAVSFLTAQPDSVNGIDLDVYDIYVRAAQFTLVDAGGGGDFNDIQPAIMAASPGDTIVVNPGNYSPIDFLGKPITVRSSNPIDPFVVDNTIIDAFGKQSVVEFQSGEGNDAVLDGFTITGGDSTNGGGIFVDGAGPSIRNCVIEMNQASGGGGGIYLSDAFLTTIEHCTFDTNTSSAGGAIMVTNFSDDVLISGCAFLGNSAVGGPEAGGAIFVESGLATIIVGCTFTSNSAPLGGAIHVNSGAAAALALVEGCIFTMNTAGSGGAIWSSGTDFDCVQSSFVSNSATDIGGGVALQNSSRAINCIFDDNSSTNQGGGAYLFSDFSEVTNCTIVNNTASDGGGVFHADADAIISNSIIVGNTPDQIDQATISINVNFNIVEGGFSGTGNIDADPLFVDESSGNFRLMSGSPAIDAASNNLFPGNLTMDFDGNDRFVDDPNVADTGDGTAPIIDMGAFESQGAMFFTVDDDGPADFSSIQAAIDAAMTGAVISVMPGTYNEVINYNGKDIAVESTNGPDVTIIDGNMMGSVVVFDSGESNNATLDGFTITNGSSSSGGGIFVSGSSPEIRNCDITNNTVGLRGGGVYVEAGGSPFFDFCDISSNDAGATGRGGGINVEGASSLTILNSSISMNTAERGGGIQCVDNGSSVDAQNCQFVGNAATNLGGAGNHGNCTADYTNCIFENNTATNGGGALNYFVSDGQIANCLAFDNSGATGGAFRVIDSSIVSIINTTVTENSGTSGGGLHLDLDADAIVDNSIFWNNGTEIVVNDVNSSALVQFSNIQGGFAGAGNIDADPVFANASADDFSLAPFSPAIDAGDNSAVPGGITMDLAGLDRFFDVTQIDDTGNGAAPIVDMGAFESQGPMTFLVDQGGGGDFTTIEAAVAAAPNGSIININPATYTPPSQINFGTKNLQLIGQGGGVIIDMQDNARHFLMQNGAQTNATIIENMTLRNGAGADGGSIFIIDGSPVFRLVTFENNEATGGQGGAVVSAGSAGNPLFENCDFIGNDALIGGGALQAASGSITINGGTTIGNSAAGTPSGQGGAFLLSSLTQANINGVVFLNNTATFNGGALFIGQSNTTIENCSFTNNSLTGTDGDGGGAINVRDDFVDIVNCDFVSNSSATKGGAVYAQLSTSTTFNGCTFDSNMSTQQGGAIANEFFSNITITNCLLFNNSSSTDGGGIYNFSDSQVTLRNSTVADNSAGGFGGGLFDGANDSNSFVMNAVVFGNTPDEIASTSTTVDFSILGQAMGGTGNVFGDPLFVDASNDNYRLSNGSPAIDAGDNTTVPGFLTNDFDGNPRFFDDTGTPDTGNGTAPIIDMGAFEFQGMSFEDCDGDGVDDSIDLTPNVAGGGFPTALFENTVGAPDSTYIGAPDDVIIGIGNGRVTYRLEGFRLIDGPGADLNVYELDSGMAEFDVIDVLVSADGMNFINIDSTIGTAVAISGDENHNDPALRQSFDLAGSGLSEARFIRIQGTDVNPPGGSNGFDLDAIGLVNTRALDANTNGMIDDCEISTLFVDANADGGGDGLSWENAYTSLSDALSFIADQQVPCIDVFVAQGSYVPPSVDVEQGDFATNTATFSIPDGANLIGGFSGDGTETDPSQADPETNLTILSGDANGDDGPNFTNRGDNSFHVVTVEPDATVTISGFIIRGGNAAGTGDDANGGGLHMSTGLLSVFDCVFEDNQATSNGGAVFMGQVEQPLGDRGVSQYFENCVFQFNLCSQTGGAVAIHSIDAAFDTCGFEFNQASDDDGGAIFVDNGLLFLDDSYLLSNVSAADGGALSVRFGSVEIFNTEFTENEAVRGGAIDATFSDLTVQLAMFFDNIADFEGGAVCFLSDGDSFELSDSMLAGNIAGGDGGAIFFDDSGDRSVEETGGDAGVRGFSFMTVSQCVFTGNDGGSEADGAAIYAQNFGSSVSIEFSSFAGNSGDSNTVFADGDLIVTNSILYDNETTQDITVFGTPNFSFSIIEDFLTSGDFRGEFEGVFSVDPLFVDVQDGNLQLLPGSPAIDAGDSQAASLPDFDLLGNPRVVDDTGTPDTGIPDDGESGPVIDMGAFEFQGTTMQPDFFPFGEPSTFSSLEPVLDLDLADLDGDGDLDVIASVSDKSDVLVWYEVTQGDFDGSIQRTIDFLTHSPIAQDVGDFNNDGDLDIVLLTDQELIVYNSNGAITPTFGEFNVFPSLLNGRSLDTGDIDNDGDLDVLVGLNSANAMRWYENTAGNGTSQFAARTVVTSSNDFQSVALADMDRDGDLDAVGVDNGGSIVLARNAGGGSSFDASTFSSAFAEIVELAIGDLNGDGAPDVIFGAASGGPPRNGFNIDTVQVAINNGIATSFNIMTAAGNIDGVKGLDVADVDNDGDMDIVLVTGGGTAEWLENDGAAGFTRRMAFDEPDGRSLRHIVSGDTTLTGRASLVISSDNEFFGNDLHHVPNQLIRSDSEYPSGRVIEREGNGITTIASADLDNDGDLDLVTGSFFDDEIIWYQNPGDTTFPWPFHVLTDFNGNTTTPGPTRVHTADVDGDGDPDIVATSILDSSVVVWFNEIGENLGNPLAFDAAVVTTNLAGAYDVDTGDFDGNGTTDLVYAGATANRIDLALNNGFGPVTGGSLIGVTVSSVATGVRSVVPADIDRDGDLDIFAALTGAGRVVWYENTTSDGLSWDENLISDFSVAPTDIAAVDFDNDGDMDIAVVDATEDSLFVYENAAGGTSWPRTTVATDLNGATAVSTGDYNRDGFPDIAVASRFENSVRYFLSDAGANRGIATSFVEADDSPISTNAMSVQSLGSADIDGDGRMDIYAGTFAGDEAVLYRNLGGQYTSTISTDLDGPVFDTDNVQVMDINVTNLAPFGDPSVAFSELRMTLNTGIGAPMNASMAASNFDRITISTLNIGNGLAQLVGELTDFSGISNGLLSVPLDGSSFSFVSPGDTQTFTVTLEIGGNAAATVPNGFEIVISPSTGVIGAHVPAPANLLTQQNAPSFTTGAISIQQESVDPCLADCDNSGVVDFNDMVCILFLFGNAGGVGDVDGSGVVDFNDLILVLFSFGPCEN